MIESSELLVELKAYGPMVKAHFDANHQWLSAMVLAVFTLVNSVRIFAYIPQMLRAARDTNGASSISCSTWSLFLISHLTTIAYAVVCLGDLLTALVFLGNAIACLAIVSVTVMKRWTFRRAASSISAAGSALVSFPDVEPAIAVRKRGQAQ